MRSFGQAVMEARENKGWSREKLAEMLDISTRHVMYMETRGQRPSVQKLYELAKLFDLSIDEHLLFDTTKSKTTRRRQLDAMLDSMDENVFIFMQVGKSVYDKLHQVHPARYIIICCAMSVPLSDCLHLVYLPHHLRRKEYTECQCTDGADDVQR